MIIIRQYFRPDMYLVVKLPKDLSGYKAGKKTDQSVVGTDYQYGDWYMVTCERPDGSRYTVHIDVGCAEGDIRILEGMNHGALNEGR